jgi:hypothetical protein
MLYLGDDQSISELISVWRIGELVSKEPTKRR